MQNRYGNLQIRKNKRRKKRIADPHLETKAGALIWLKIQEIKILILSKQISNDSVEFLWLPVQIPVFGSVYETKAVLFQSASLRLGTLLRPVFLPSFCKANTFFPKCFLFSVFCTLDQKADTLQIPLSLPAIRWAERGRSWAPSTCSRCEFNFRWHFPCRGLSLRDTSQLRPRCPRPQLGQIEEGERGRLEILITL